jgi:hypothetical protein
MQTNLSIFLSITFLMTFGATPSVAQTADYDKFSVGLGVFFTDRETNTRFDSEDGIAGTDVDLEGDLGLDKSDSVFRIDASYRFAPKHQINFSAFDLSRSASSQLQKEISWQGSVFLVGTVVEADFDLTIYKIDYTWRFVQRDQGYFGVTGGLYIADFSTRLSAPETNQLELSNATAPLPVIGLRGKYDFSKKWSFRADGEIFFLEYGDWGGSLYDVYAGIEYGLFEHMGIGIGVNAVKANIEVTKPDLSGNLDFQYEGALVFFTFDF